MLMREKNAIFGGLVFAAFLFSWAAIALADPAAVGGTEQGARSLAAFPGAEGAAKYTPGGRGGDVYVVENTEPDGPGSLRYGIETAEGPRTIVFATGGTIRFKTGHLMIRDRERLTIAGQTAPGDGITLRFDNGGVRIINSEDIVVTHLRICNGSSETRQDNLRASGSKNVFLSHLSVRWGARGNWILRPDGPLSLQYSINAEPTDRRLAGWFGHMREDEGHFTHTIRKNLGIHQRGRINMFQRGGFEFMNNLTFNARSAYEPGSYYIFSRPQHGTAASDLGPQLVEVNAVGNVMIDDRSSPPDFTFGFGRASRVYLNGNMRDRSPDLPFSPEPADDDICDGSPRRGRPGNEFELVGQLMNLDLREAQGLTEEQRTRPVSARQAYIDVLSRSGASASRDVHDHRYVRDVMNKHTRALPSTLGDIPGEPFPELDPGTPPKMSADDGIPDAWKQDRGLDPEKAYHQVFTDQGYTYLEKYLHSLAPHGFPPDSSATGEIRVCSSYGEGGTAAVILENVLHYGLLRFDLSQVEPGMFNDASVLMDFGDIEEPAGFRVYGLDHDRAGQRWAGGTIGPADAPAMEIEDGKVSLRRDDLILIGDIKIDPEAGGAGAVLDNPNLAVFLNLAVYAQAQPDSHLVTLLLEPAKAGAELPSGAVLQVKAVPATGEVMNKEKARRIEAVVKEFADNVLEHGRDRWSGRETPLFADGLRIESLEPAVWRHGGKEYLISNYASQQNLMRTLVALTRLSGDKKYKQAAVEATAYMFDNHQYQRSGLLPWGGHRFIDLKTLDDVYGFDANAHELKRHFPYYDLMFEVNPKSAARMVRGIWESHIYDWSNEFYHNRHGSWNARPDDKTWERPFSDPDAHQIIDRGTMAHTSKDMMYAAVHAYAHLPREEQGALLWATRKGEMWEKARDPQTGLGSYHYHLGHNPRTSWGSHMPGRNDAGYEWSNLFKRLGKNPESYGKGASSAVTGTRFWASSGWPRVIYGDAPVAQYRMAEILGEKDGEKFMHWAHSAQRAFALSKAYNPENNTINRMLTDGRVLEEDFTSGCLRLFYSFSLGYRMTGDEALWHVVRGVARGRNLGDVGASPGAEAELNLDTGSANAATLLSFLELYRALDKPAYLAMAGRIADNIMEQRFRNGFFVRSDQHIHVRFDDPEPFALLSLAAVLRGVPEIMPPYPNGSAYIHGRFDGAGRTYDSRVIWNRRREQ